MQFRDAQDHPLSGSALAASAQREEERANDAELLTPGEVARLFGVDPKTVTRWASAGKLTALRTLGGHRRYRATEVYALLEKTDSPAVERPGTGGVTSWT